MLREAIDPLGIPIFGVLHRNANIKTPDRHLGLVPAAERRDEARKALDRTGEAIARSCDLEGIVRLAATAEPFHSTPWSPVQPASGRTETVPVRVAVASGPAFSFVYRENLEL